MMTLAIQRFYLKNNRVSKEGNRTNRRKSNRRETEVKKQEWELLVKTKPAWTRKPEEITKAACLCWEEAVEQFNVEGQLEAILDVPKCAPFDMFDRRDTTTTQSPSCSNNIIIIIISIIVNHHSSNNTSFITTCCLVIFSAWGVPNTAYQRSDVAVTCVQSSAQSLLHHSPLPSRQACRVTHEDVSVSSGGSIEVRSAPHHYHYHHHPVVIQVVQCHFIILVVQWDKDIQRHAPPSLPPSLLFHQFLI